MHRMLLILLTMIAGSCFAQVTVDTTKTIVTVKEKTTAGIKTMTIYKSFVEGRGMCNQIVYQPGTAELGDEPVAPMFTLIGEIPHMKVMLDEAMKKRRYNFSRISTNVVQYKDLTEMLANVYTSSNEWNDYVKKTNVRRTTKLFDGTEVSEIAYDAKIAGDILNKSDFLKELNTFFAQYGYKVDGVEFPEDHQQTVAPEVLALLGKPNNFVVPVPGNFFTLTKKKN